MLIENVFCAQKHSVKNVTQIVFDKQFVPLVGTSRGDPLTT